MSGKYDDIIGLPHHVSETHAQMPLSKRAAQFAPFAALTGYEEAVKEAARLTEMKTELTDEARLALGDKLSQAVSDVNRGSSVDITYFVPDRRKDGGEYVTVSGTIKRIDHYTGCVIMSSGLKISMDDICSIDGDFFEE